jgi:hypothetical protein
MLALYGVSLHAVGLSGYDQTLTGQWKRMCDAIIKTRLKAKNKIEVAQNCGRLYNLKVFSVHSFHKSLY